MNCKFPLNRKYMQINDKERRPVQDSMNTALGRAYFMDMLNRMKPKSERIAPDKRGCETIFARAFVNEKMTWDFPIIARDFLKQEYVNIQEYKDLAYGDDMPQYCGMSEFWQRTMVHAMYEGAKKGSDYCIALFKYLFKTYYSMLYKSFKRFSVFSADEIISLSETDDGEFLDVYTIAILLCMAEIHGIKLREECDALYLMLDEKSKEQETLTDIEFLQFPDGLFAECKKDVEELFGSDIRCVLKRKFKSERFAYNTLKYHGYPEEFVLLNKEGNVDIWGELARTMALLRMTYPGKEFTKEEILLYANIYEAINAFTYTTDNVYTTMIDVLGLGDDAFYEEEDVWFDPEKIAVTLSASKQSPKVEPVMVIHKSDDREYLQDTLLKEIEELRTKLHIKVRENRHLRQNLQDAKRLQEEHVGLTEELESNRQELAALRYHLYHFTEFDEPVVVAEMDSMVNELNSKKVTVVGGHINWVKKMKKIFSNWDFIGPSISVSNEGKWISHAEFVYFFTDTLSHSVYNTFIQVVREQKVPFGYIHGVNIEANVKQIWDDLIEKRR